MAFAPYINEYRNPETRGRIVGQFTHRETGATFEYAERLNPHPHEPRSESFPYTVFVGPLQETRFARVHKTVAHVVIDEDETGWVTEKWPLKKHRIYAGGN